MEPLDVDFTWDAERGPWKTGLAVGVGSAFFIGALCAAGIAYEFLQFGVNAGSYLISGIVAVFGIFSFWMGFWGVRGFWRPLNDAIHVDESGLTLKLSDRSQVSFLWQDPRTRFRLLELNGPDVEVNRSGVLQLPGRTWIDLSKDQSERLRAWMSAAGLDVRTKKDWIKYRGPATAYIARGGTRAFTNSRASNTMT